MTTTMTRTDLMLSEALQLAELGRHVFFLGASKRPIANCDRCRDATEAHRTACGCVTCHGFYAATTNPDRIRAMRAAVPRGILAMRTGAVSGVVVVDIDPRNGGQVDTTLMPRTTCVATGGGGWHLYYRHPGTPIPSRPMPGRAGVDIKADGGYVVVPPSVHPGTRQPYRLIVAGPLVEMPLPLLAACQPPPEPPAPPVGTVNTRTGDGIAHPDRLLAAHLAAVANAPEGKRRNTLYGAARGVARMVAAGAIRRADAVAVLTEAGQRAEQSSRQIREAIEGGFRAEGVHL